MSEVTTSTITHEKSKWRADFPLLSRKFNGKPMIYLDSAATSLKPWPVIERVGHFLTYETANVHRGAHFLANQATEAYEAARQTVAQFIDANDASEIIFTRGTTESMNLVAQSWGLTNLKAGDEIVMTEMEHHSVIVPWQLVAERTGAKIVVVPVTSNGEISIEEFRKKVTPKTKVASVVHCSNTLGTINDIAAMTKIVHAVGAIMVVDGAQIVANHPLSMKKLGVDFFAFSGHKVFGPYGIGVLYGRQELLEKMPPYQGGGSMIHDVTFEKTTYHDVPFRFEAGTPNIEGALGLKAALDFVTKQSWSEIIAHENELRIYAEKSLQQIPGVRIIGQAKEKAPIVSFILEGTHPSDVGQILDQQNIAVRTGHHCTQPLMAAYKIPATVRASFSIYNQKSDVDALIAGLNKAKEMLL